MSKAYVCDRCGRMQPESIRSLWTLNPYLIDRENDEFRIDLFADCYEMFEGEFLANLREEGGFIGIGGAE